MAMKDRMNRNTVTSLQVQSKMWATPTTMDTKASGNGQSARDNGWLGTLTDQAVRNWPRRRSRGEGHDPIRTNDRAGD